MYAVSYLQGVVCVRTHHGNAGAGVNNGEELSGRLVVSADGATVQLSQLLRAITHAITHHHAHGR